MEVKREVDGYIVRWYGHLMTKAELRAQRHLSATMKATKGRSDLSAQAEAQGHSPFLSDEPEVLRLAAGGYEKFVARTAARILTEHPNEVSFNRCPKCGGLARTPTARQCRFCGYDWHDIG
jgi:hypothetical protein